MKTYEFTLKFSFPDEGHVDDIDELVERLGEAGCDDALVGIGKSGRLALDFTREAESAFDAISSAIATVRKTIPDARIVEATPDLVGFTDVAEIIGCSRQNIRKIMLTGSANFPVPVHEGKSTLWRLSNVLAWLRDNRPYPVADELMEVASVNMQINVARETGSLEPYNRDRILALVN